MHGDRILLDPEDVAGTLARLQISFNLEASALPELGRVVPLLPTAAFATENRLEDPAALVSPLADRFTFDVHENELVLFETTPETLVNAVIEMAMYLAGFSTLIDDDDLWATQFTIGAWKHARDGIKRSLNISIPDRRGVVGLPPPHDRAPTDDPYPFRTLVSRFDLASFYQMVLLAGHEAFSVYFPPSAHSRVQFTYTYMREAMRGIAADIGINDVERFNQRLREELRRIEDEFHPEQLVLPDAPAGGKTGQDEVRRTRPRRDDDLGIFPREEDIAATHKPASSDVPASDDVPGGAPSDDPFEAFINELFADEDND